ncbi:MAG: branched-chain amino acid ABC transporter permease [Burkholderiales bacterium]|nr:branched-chain amino acid ABC transporter permease [Burkholderiales bacterium]MDE2394024.1 branched-chain amino acid ABC transporter permease [Burkholderiales bacterium]MDE2456777.1 branched-chain amino acid ABC transporter permease [Burkholderiales bacterium]
MNPLDIPPAAIVGQLIVGLINGSFYALLSLGLAIIFGLLHIVNFAHGALYMVGAFIAWALLQYLGLGYWWALLIVPLVTAVLGMLAERTMLRRLQGLDPVYALLLTFGLALVLEGAFRLAFGATGQPYASPLSGGFALPFAYLPAYRIWVIVASMLVCFATWWFVERTRFGATLRAAHENPSLVRTFGIRVPLLLTLTYGLGVGLAGLAGVMAAPIYQVSPLMGSDLIVVVFAVVVIGGMGSIIGSIVSGFGLGVIEGLTRLLLPDASGIVVFVVMLLVLAFKPAGLFGRGDL